MIVLPRLADLFKIYIDKQTWKEQWITLNKIAYKKALFIDYELREDAYEMARLFLVVAIQHGTGGILASFSILPDNINNYLGLSKNLIYSLACHGALSETGYELQDYIIRISQYLFKKDGWKRSPPTLLLMMSLHHFSGFFLIVPLYLKFRDSFYYHELIFLMQFAACISLILTNYGQLLNIEDENGLRQMKVVSTLTFIVILWSRIIRFCYVVYLLVCLSFIQESFNFTMFLIFSCFTIFVINFLFFAESYRKFIKFIYMKPGHVKMRDVLDENFKED